MWSKTNNRVSILVLLLCAGVMAFGAGFAFGQVDPESPPGAMGPAEEAPVDQVPVPDPAPIVDEVPAMVTPAEETPPPTWEELWAASQADLARSRAALGNADHGAMTADMQVDEAQAALDLAMTARLEAGTAADGVRGAAIHAAENHKDLLEAYIVRLRAGGG